MNRKVGRHIFNLQKLYGGHSPQTISAIHCGQCDRKSYALEVWNDQQNILRYWTE